MAMLLGCLVLVLHLGLCAVIGIPSAGAIGKGGGC